MDGCLISLSAPISTFKDKRFPEMNDHLCFLKPTASLGRDDENTMFSSVGQIINISNCSKALPLTSYVTCSESI